MRSVRLNFRVLLLDALGDTHRLIWAWHERAVAIVAAIIVAYLAHIADPRRAARFEPRVGANGRGSEKTANGDCGDGSNKVAHGALSSELEIFTK
jgi:hypothetical protein